jgi:hypothetical protein
MTLNEGVGTSFQQSHFSRALQVDRRHGDDLLSRLQSPARDIKFEKGRPLVPVEVKILYGVRKRMTVKETCRDVSELGRFGLSIRSRLIPSVHIVPPATHRQTKTNHTTILATFLLLDPQTSPYKIYHRH